MKEFNLLGPKQETDPNHNEANESLKRLFELGKEIASNEIEKTELHLKAIEAVNQMIKSLFRNLGLKNTPEIDLDRVHILPGVEFENIGGPINNGVYISTRDAIYLNNDKLNSNVAHFITTLLHESLHAVSVKKFYVDVSEESNGVYDARVGFRTSSHWKKNRTELRGLNEFAVETMVLYLIDSYTEVLCKRFNLKQEDFKAPIYGVGLEHQLLFDSLLQQLIDSGVDAKTFLFEVAKAHFDGKLSSLKLIDRHWGSGSIRVLGYLDSFLDDHEQNKKVNALVEEYFLRATPERKDEIKRELEVYNN